MELWIETLKTMRSLFVHLQGSQLRRDCVYLSAWGRSRRAIGGTVVGNPGCIPQSIGMHPIKRNQIRQEEQLFHYGVHQHLF